MIDIEANGRCSECLRHKERTVFGVCEDCLNEALEADEQYQHDAWEAARAGYDNYIDTFEAGINARLDAREYSHDD